MDSLLLVNLTFGPGIVDVRIIKNSMRMSVSALKMSTQTYSFFHIFFSLFLQSTTIQSITIGEACSPNVSVHDTFCFMSPGLITSALIVEDTEHSFSGFLRDFL